MTCVFFVFAIIVVWVPLGAMSVFESQEIGAEHTATQDLLLFATLRLKWPKYSLGQRRFIFAVAQMCGAIGLASAWLGGAAQTMSVGLSPFDDYAVAQPWLELLLIQFGSLAGVRAWFALGKKSDD